MVNTCLVLQLFHLNQTNTTFFSHLDAVLLQIPNNSSTLCCTGWNWSRKMWYRANMKEAVIEGRHEECCDTRQIWRKPWNRAYMHKAVIQGIHKKGSYMADIKNAVLDGRHKENCNTGQILLKAKIQGRHQGRCYTDWRNLWYLQIWR